VWSWTIKSGEKKHAGTATLRSPSGFEVTVLDVGAALQSIVVPTASGPLECILGYKDPTAYWSDPYYVGATVGRFANRIRGGRIVVDATEHQLDINEASTGNCLHGGVDGFHRQRFDFDREPDSTALVCRLVSPAGAQGFPARINAHHLSVAASRYTPVDEMQIPTGEIASVDDSIFDLRVMAELVTRSYDHNFVSDGEAGEIRVLANLYSPDSGVGLSVHSTQAALQVYTGDSLNTPFIARQGIALEAQNFPDAPNQKSFPSARLAPDETYRQQTIYEFTLPRQ